MSSDTLTGGAENDVFVYFTGDGNDVEWIKCDIDSWQWKNYN